MDDVERFRSWLREYLKRTGRVWPSSYIVIDTETTGLEAAKDVPYQISHFMVVDRVLHSSADYVANWPACPLISDNWLVERLCKLDAFFERNGHVVVNLHEKMRRDGRPALEVLERYCQLFHDLPERGLPLLGHNLLFDLGMLDSAFTRFLQRDCRPDDLELWDTGLMEKAAFMWPDVRSYPLPGEDHLDYMLRIQQARVKVKWSLDRTMVPKYQLTELYAIDPAAMHDSYYDSYVTHVLFEEMRDRYDVPIVTGGEEEVVVTVPAALAAAGETVAASPLPTRYRGQRVN